MRRPPNPKPAPAPEPAETPKAAHAPLPAIVFEAWYRARTRISPNALGWTPEAALHRDCRAFARACREPGILTPEAFHALMARTHSVQRQMLVRNGLVETYGICWDRQLLPALRVAA
ncbi:hypothetical protein SAMN05444678_102233 [Sphingomonas sp. YR710]|uniref:hypothetical protein n=1 Tax=Sphingomonas sp. YR710 TaxID=1882773 RepID=UPI000886E174|nr:hypothetical protein [Sphingomonas sp. YR710]SDC29861.1 hypothetical protein SAMN05444678_102233 [Sphingomonas sp. YR710]